MRGEGRGRVTQNGRVEFEMGGLNPSANYAVIM